MSPLTGITNFFGLDIGTSGIRLVELKSSGTTKSLINYALVPIDPRLVLSDAKTDQQKVAAIIKQLVLQAKTTSKNVCVSLPSSRVFTVVFDMDKLSTNELDKSIRFQADTLIPTPLENSKIDWALLGQSPMDANKIEVLLSSVPNSYVENLVNLLEGVGLNVVGIEPEAIALARAVLPKEVVKPQLVLDIGSTSSDLVIVMNNGPRLIRSIPGGSEFLIKSVAENLSIDHNQAQEFVFKFGMSKNKVEGQIFNALVTATEGLFDELEKSIKFFQNRYKNTSIEKIYVTGAAASIPEFPLYLANKYSINVEIGNAWTNISIPENKKNELLAISSSFAVAAGLAGRNE
jgi:type IV pilus assembly protein PilM